MSIPNDISPALSKRTNEALALVTDPYHDYNLPTYAYPDGTNLISAVKRYTSRTTVRCPFILTPGDTWDFHIFATPLHQIVVPLEVQITGNALVMTSTNNLTIGPLNIWYYHYASDGTLKASTSEALGQPISNDDIRTTQRRTVSFGYELHNITPELYREGSLTVYRTPVVNSSADFVHGSSFYHTNIIGSFPTDLQAANLLPNSRTWEAKKGAYCVNLPAPVNDFSTILSQNFVMKMGKGNSYYGLQPGTSTDASYRVTWSSLACTGIFSSRFASDAQAFSLDMRQVLELAPNASDTNTLMFASSCPPLDRMFIKIYKRMFNEIPPGTQVSNNASGDWFRKIVAISRYILPAIFGALPVPGAGAMQTGLQAALNALNNKLNTTTALVQAVAKQSGTKSVPAATNLNMKQLINAANAVSAAKSKTSKKKKNKNNANLTQRFTTSDKP